MFEEKVLGGILGFVVADALGVPVEFEDREYLRLYPVTDMRGYGSYDVPAGSWSDDSSMTLCALESLTHGLDYDDMMSRFLRWADEGYMTPHGEVFDMGITTREALLRYAKGTPALECGSVSELANGNGSLMRMLPVAFYLYHLRCTTAISRRESLPIIHNASALTHAHPISLISCSIYCHIVHNLLNGHSLKDAIADASNLIKKLYQKDHPEYHGWLNKFNHVDADVLLHLTEDDIRSSGYVLDTLEAALWCLLHTDSYRDCVLKAVNLGSDTDTVAAVAGGLAGLYYGTSAIPTEWSEVIPKRDMIESLCKDFCSANTSKSLHEEHQPTEHISADPKLATREATELELGLIGLLRSSKAGKAAQMMVFIWLKTDEQMLEMCKYLLENEDATEGQILRKCRQLLGEN